jgi:HTH-type transcriptional regulator/antitoxin HigA
MMTERIPAQCFHPGEYVRDEMEARKWDVAELAKRMSVHDMPVEIAVSLIECKLDITPNIAFGLRRAFGTSADLWMNLQKAFDVWQESRPTLFAADAGERAGKA